MRTPPSSFSLVYGCSASINSEDNGFQYCQICIRFKAINLDWTYGAIVEIEGSLMPDLKMYHSNKCFLWRICFQNCTRTQYYTSIAITEFFSQNIVALISWNVSPKGLELFFLEDFPHHIKKIKSVVSSEKILPGITQSFLEISKWSLLHLVQRIERGLGIQRDVSQEL